MANVHCQSCGRTYDYEKYGCCPNCGAYNRRPRRAWVDVDGTVHHGASKQEKVCYEKKTCYEKKVCFEEQARPARKKNPLRQLEQDGLIERITDPNDRRKTLVRPTEKGLDASRQVEAAISRYFERVICRIPEEQREQLFSLTGVLLEAVEAENAEQQAKLKGENKNG